MEFRTRVRQCMTFELNDGAEPAAGQIFWTPVGRTRPYDRPKTRAGRTRPPSRRTGPHPYVPTRLLENWIACTCTGFLVILVRDIHYPALGTPEQRVRSRPQPWQITTFLAETGRSINKRAATVQNRDWPRFCGHSNRESREESNWPDRCTLFYCDQLPCVTIWSDCHTCSLYCDWPPRVPDRWMP
jgi:hypothetical protein